MPSCEEFLKSKSLKAFVVYGKKGSGQKELAEQILDRILCDQTLAIRAQKLSSKDSFRVEYTSYDQTIESPYKAFAEIERLMKRRRHLFSIFNRIFRLALAFAAILDPIDKLKELANEIKQSDDKKDALREKEIKLFKQFTREIERFSRKKPLLITIGNAQWMDRSSCQLLKYLLRESSFFWGLVVLEYTTDEFAGSQTIDSILWDLIKEDKIQTIKARLLDIAYIEKYQKDKIGKILFTGDEAERVIELAQEMPSKLDELIETWKYQKLIYKENGDWVKSKSLKLKELTTPEEKLIELYKVFSTDNKFTAKEEEAFYSQARSLGFSDEQVDKIRTVAQFEALNPRYHIVRKVRTGTIGDIFKAFDQERNRNVFIEIDQRLRETQVEGGEAGGVMSASLLNTLEVRHADNFNFIVTEYTRGITLEDLRPEYMFFDFQKTYLISKNMLSAISLLHRKNFIHGNIRPDNVFIEDDGSVKVGGIGFIKNLKYDVGKGLVFAKKSPFSSPEHIEGESLTLQSDVFSLGVILYELFTGQLPFPGDNEKQISEAILSNPIRQSQYLELHTDLKSIIYKALDKNDQARPSSAESLNIAFDHIDHPKHERPVPSSGQKKSLAKPSSPYLKWVLIPILIIGLLIAGRQVIKIVFPVEYDTNQVSINRFSYDAGLDLPKDIIENLLQRSILASPIIKGFIVTRNPLLKWKNEGKETPGNIISGNVIRDRNGYDIRVILNHEGNKITQDFHCAGHDSLLTTTIDKIHLFLSDKSNGTIKNMANGKSLKDYFTDDWQACDFFYQGQDAWEKIDTDNAKILLRRALSYDTDFSLVNLKLSEVLVWNSDYKLAKQQISQAQKAGHRLIPADLILARALAARINADPKAERDELERLTELFPNDKKVYYIFGEAFFHYSEIEKAKDKYRRALEIDPGFGLAHNHLGFCYAWSGDHAAAEREFQNYVSIDKRENPKVANSYDSLASGYMFAGKYDEAIKTCLQGLEVEPASDGFIGNMASNQLLLGRLKEASKSWGKRIEITKEENNKINCQFYLGLIEYLRGQRAPAKSINDKVKQFYSSAAYDNELGDSSNLPVWLDGLIAFDENNTKSLENCIERLGNKVLTYKVDEFDNYQRIYKYYVHLKLLDAFVKKDRATLDELLKSVSRIKNKLGYWSSIFNVSYMFNQCASLLIKLKDLDKAETFLNEAYKYNNYDPQTYLNMVQISLLKKNTEQAKTNLKKARELLERSDEDYVLVKNLKELEGKTK
jgi:serine/threonine protein kinase